MGGVSVATTSVKKGMGRRKGALCLWHGTLACLRQVVKPVARGDALGAA